MDKHNMGTNLIGDSYIIKNAGKLTPLQKSLAELHRQHFQFRSVLAAKMGEDFVKEFMERFPKVEDREKMLSLIEKKFKGVSEVPEVKPIEGISESIVKGAKEIETFLRKNITEPEMRQGLLSAFKEGYVPHIVPKHLQKILGKQMSHPIIAVNKFGRTQKLDPI